MTVVCKMSAMSKLNYQQLQQSILNKSNPWYEHFLQNSNSNDHSVNQSMHHKINKL